MNTLYVKLLGAGAVALVIFFGYQYVTNLQEANAALEKEVTELKITKQKLEAEREQVKEDLANVRVNLEEVNQKFKEAEQSKNELIKLFADHDFEKLVAAKPGLITRKMQRATEEIFTEIENESK
jgi:septal ring factor EnvC (AmiA/AmiB activator)